MAATWRALGVAGAAVTGRAPRVGCGREQPGGVRLGAAATSPGAPPPRAGGGAGVRRRPEPASGWAGSWRRSCPSPILAASGYAWASYQHFTSGLTRIDGVPGSKAGDKDGAAQNILLVGDDHRPANASQALLAQLGTQQDGGGTNTDTMMVLHLPAHGGAPTAISFPRDSWVDIPGYGKGKLNSAFADGAANGGGDAARDAAADHTSCRT